MTDFVQFWIDEGQRIMTKDEQDKVRTMWNERIQLGIPKPEKEPENIDEMRKAIGIASRESNLVRSAIDTARYTGKSGEDTYVLIAYSALRALETHYQMNMEWLATQPSPKFIAPVCRRKPE